MVGWWFTSIDLWQKIKMPILFWSLSPAHVGCMFVFFSKEDGLNKPWRQKGVTSLNKKV
jgi:hypothetical protein